VQNAHGHDDQANDQCCKHRGVTVLRGCVNV
jgi:hypothetical protein